MDNSYGKKEVNMLEGSLTPKIIWFALPLALSSIVQQLFNSCDVAVVGRFAGDDSLAATGACVSLVGIFVNLIAGLSVGPNAALSLMIGKGKRNEIHDMVHTIIAFSVILGFLLLGLGFLIARPVLIASGTPSGILNLSITYIKIYFVGIPFMVIYNFGASILRSFGDTKRPMYTLFVSGFLNVLLNLLFVIVFNLDVIGVAMATTISNLLNAIVVLVLLYKEKGDFKFRFKDLLIKKNFLKQILKIGVPAGIQGSIFSVSNVFIQSGINIFGEYAIGGSSIAINFEYFVYYLGNGFSQAATTFVGQNYGAGKIDRCKKSFKLCMLFGLTVSEILAIIFVIFADFFVGIYSTSEKVIYYAMIRMWHVVLLEGLTATYETSASTLRGLGKSIEPTIYTILGTVVFRLIWLYTIFRHFGTYESVINVYVCSWIFTGALVTIACLKHLKRLEQEQNDNNS